MTQPLPGRNVASSDPGPAPRTAGTPTDGSKPIEPLAAQIVPGSYQSPLELPPGQASVPAGQAYVVKTSDALIMMDSTGAGTLGVPSAALPKASFVDERHTFFWFGWDDSQAPPAIYASADAQQGRLSSVKLSPATGMQQSGSSGLVASTNFVQTGSSLTYAWSGTDWLLVATAP